MRGLATLGETIRRLRQHAGLTQAQLAGPDLTRAFICMIESGKAKPSMKNLELIAQRLGQPLALFLDAPPEPEEQATLEVLMQSSEALLQAGRPQEAVTALEQAVKVSLRQPHANGQFRAYERLGVTLLGLNQFDQALDAFERYLDLGRTLQQPPRITRALMYLGDTVYAMNQFLVARRYYDRAVRETDERKSLLDQRQEALIRKGNCLMRLGEYMDAAIAYEEAAELHDYLGDEPQLAQASMGLGVAYRRLGRTARAREATMRSLTLMQKLGDARRVLVLQNLAMLEGEAGNWAGALGMLETCREAYHLFGWQAAEASLLEELAQYWHQAGDPHKAAACCHEALALLEQQDDPLLRGRLLKHLGENALANSLLRYFGRYAQ